MSGASARRISRSCFVMTALLLTLCVGCWEQWSDTWFPQMKRQKAIQAFELVEYRDQVEGFMPPEGAVPVSSATPHFEPTDDATANALENPRPMTLESLENGREQYARNCTACHGAQGLGNGPVSMTGDMRGPLGGVLAVAGPASIARVRSDGHIYATIRYGRRRMPSYQRITSTDRWDIVNYIRYLNGQKGIGQ